MNQADFDILIQNALIVTVDSSFTVIEKGFLAIKDSKIVELGSGTSKKTALKTIQADSKLIMPGLINTHTHAAMVMFRGIADDFTLQEWLFDYILPAEQKFVNEPNVRKAAELAIVEMILSGTTTFSDMYFFSHATAEIAEKIGIRAVIGEGFSRYKSPRGFDDSQTLAWSEKFIGQYKNHPLITIAIAPHSPYACTPESLIKAADLAKNYDVPLQIHLDETQSEHESFVKAKNQSPTEFLASINALTDKTIAAHCVRLTQNDMQILKKIGVGISHNPQSNMKLASGIAPVPQMLAHGLKVGLGTDGAASNNNLDLVEELSSAARLHKLAQTNQNLITARQIVKMATLGGAQVLGLQDKIGSLQVGKQADLIVIDLQKPHLRPYFDPHSLIAYTLNSNDIETVIIDGKVVMENRKFKNANPISAIEAVEEIAKQIKINQKK